MSYKTKKKLYPPKYTTVGAMATVYNDWKMTEAEWEPEGYTYSYSKTLTAIKNGRILCKRIVVTGEMMTNLDYVRLI